MSTSSERLEAGVWLDPILPDLPPERRANVFAGVDGYYTRYPTADRGPDALAALKEDTQAFARILSEAIPEDDPMAAAVDVVLDTRSS